MPQLPERHQQIITMHAAFINQVVQFSQNEADRPNYEQLLISAEENGWSGLVAAIRQIVAGQRDMGAIKGLDEEDQVIAEAIMRGLQNPATLPDPDAKPDPAMAVPGLAGMIQAAATGNVEALTLISNMAEQMSKAGGPMARLAAVIRPLINGERDPDKLCKGMNTQTEQLVLGILDELAKTDLH
ncbi:MAG: hypothetical protein ABW089_14250 [Sedimenticola sp.]